MVWPVSCCHPLADLAMDLDNLSVQMYSRWGATRYCSAKVRGGSCTGGAPSSNPAARESIGTPSVDSLLKQRPHSCTLPLRDTCSGYRRKGTLVPSSMGTSTTGYTQRYSSGRAALLSTTSWEASRWRSAGSVRSMEWMSEGKQRRPHDAQPRWGATTSNLALKLEVRRPTISSVTTSPSSSVATYGSA